jgi:nucleoside-diphosphate-sugar epimerase
MIRDFTYIDDVTSAITAVLEQDIDKNYSIYNVGSSNPHSVITLLHTIEHKLGIKANYISSKALEGDVKYTCASTDLIRKNYTLPPATNFSEGISLFCKWIKEYLF